MAFINVLCGNRKQFEYWCYKHKIYPKSDLVRYIYEPHQLRGVRDDLLITFGSPYDQRNYRYIVETARALGMTIIAEKDE